MLATYILSASMLHALSVYIGLHGMPMLSASVFQTSFKHRRAAALTVNEGGRKKEGRKGKEKGMQGGRKGWREGEREDGRKEGWKHSQHVLICR